MSERKISGVPLNTIPLNPENNFYVAANNIKWNELCNIRNIFKSAYRTLQPPRRMLGLLILGDLLKISEEKLLNQWLEIPYYQYFTGESLFHWSLPVSVEELVLFKTELTTEIIQEIQRISFSISNG